MGDSFAGKTSLARAMNGCSDTLENPTTIGVEFFSIKYGSSIIKLFDTAGTERFRCVLPIYIRDSDVIIVCIDSTCPYESICEQVLYWLNFIYRHAMNNPMVYISMCKSDLKHMDCVTYLDSYIKSRFVMFSVSVIYTSAKDNENVKQLMFMSSEYIYEKKCASVDVSPHLYTRIHNDEMNNRHCNCSK